MSKNHAVKKENAVFIREKIKQFYLNKCFNLFMNHYHFKGLSDQQNNYIKRKFWCDGKVWGFIVEGTKTTNEELGTSKGELAFCPFAPFTFNIYDYPIKVNLINVRGVNFIPSTPQENNVDGVIGYAQRNKKPILTMVEFYIDEIVDIEMAMRGQLKAHKIALLLKTSPENEERMKRFNERIENDETVIFISTEDESSTENLNINNPYILDKLYMLKQQRENELLTFLGINNVGGIEKQEHLAVDEVNSNNQLITESGDCIKDCLIEFANAIKNILGYDVEVETKGPKPLEKEEETDDA